MRFETVQTHVSQREEGDLHSLLPVSGGVGGLITVVEHENVTSFRLCAAFAPGLVIIALDVLKF